MTLEEFAEEYKHLLPFLLLVDSRSEERVTYFEALTALAYLWFADKPVGLGVYEVGMGGPWDATNLVAGDVAVITPDRARPPASSGRRSREVAHREGRHHQGGEGRGRPRAARRGARRHPGARAAVGAELKQEFRDWEVEDRLRRRRPGAPRAGLYGTYDDLYVPLFGEHAARNAAAAIAAPGGVRSARALDAGRCARRSPACASPGRLEVVGRKPLIVLDGAHNPAGAEALAAAMREFFTWDRLHLVVAVSAEQGRRRDDPAAGAARRRRVRRAQRERARGGGRADRGAVRRRGQGRSDPFDSVAEALAAAQAAAGADDLILVTGSLYTVADARRALGP